MRLNKGHITTDHLLWGIFIAGIAIGLGMQLYFQKFLNIDTLAYINIAELYADGNFIHAINGCWSPLYSWIIAVLLKIGIPALTTCYILNFAAAAVCFYFLNRMAKKFLFNHFLYVLFHLYLVFFLLFHSLSALTPDLLSTALGLWLVNTLMSERFFFEKKISIEAGIAAGLMYLAKAYNFLFCIALFSLLIFFKLANKKTRSQCKQLLYSLIVFLGLSLLWIIPISIHERRVTFSTAGVYVHKYVHPLQPYHPSSSRIVPPPFEGAYSSWTDPVKNLDGYGWSPFENKTYFLHQLDLIRVSLDSWYNIVDPYWLRSLLLVSCLVILFLKGKEKFKTVLGEMKIPLIVIFLYPSGYLPIFVLERYILISTILFHFFLFYVLQEAVNAKQIKYLFGMCAIVSLFFLPPLARAGKSLLIQRMKDYEGYRAFHKNIYQLDFLKGKRIVADNTCHLISVQLCYRLKTTFYGIWNGKEVEKAKAYNVEYLLSKNQWREKYLQKVSSLGLTTDTVYVYRFNY